MVKDKISTGKKISHLKSILEQPVYSSFKWNKYEQIWCNICNTKICSSFSKVSQLDYHLKSKCHVQLKKFQNDHELNLTRHNEILQTIKEQALIVQESIKSALTQLSTTISLSQSTSTTNQNAKQEICLINQEKTPFFQNYLEQNENVKNKQIPLITKQNGDEQDDFGFQEQENESDKNIGQENQEPCQVEVTPQDNKQELRFDKIYAIIEDLSKKVDNINQQDKQKMVDYKEEMKQHVISEKTLKFYKQYNEAFDDWQKKTFPNTQIALSQVQDFISENYKKKDKSTGPLIAALQLRFNQIENRNYHLKKLKQQAQIDRKTPHKAIDPSKTKEFLNTLDLYQTKKLDIVLAARLQLEMGLRFQDLFELKKEDFVEVNDGEFFKNNNIWQKKNQEKRTGIISKETMNLIDQYTKIKRFKDNKYFFQNDDIGAMYNFRQRYQRILQKPCFKEFGNLTTHDLRHTYAVEQKSLGYDEKFISKSIGHKSSTAIQCYIPAESGQKMDDMLIQQHIKRQRHK